MKNLSQAILILLFSCLLLQASAQNNGHSGQKVWVDSAVFSPKLFIENKGQFDHAPYLPNDAIFYAVKQGASKMFFSKTKIFYALHKIVKNQKNYNEFLREESKNHTSGSESEEEIREEERLKTKIFKTLTEVINMEWIGANEDCKIKPENISEMYFNYGMDKDPNHDINYVPGYKKITYQNLYNAVDVEYTFHPQTGIKYNIIVHPGADISEIKLKYSGAKDVSLDASHNLVIKTEMGDIIDHAPVSFQNNNGTTIKTKFVLQNNTISFQIEKYDNTKTLVIDPWVSSTLTTLDTAYEIAVDPAGNVWVYGDYNSEVKKYNNAGVAQWSFTSGPGYLYNASLIGGDITVDPTGNSYCSGSECVRKLSPAGTSLWLYAPSRNITNIACCETGWRMVFDPTNNRLYGGGSNGQTKATWYDPATGNPEWLPNGWNACNIISGPCPSACPNANGEIRHITRAPNGNFYAYTAIGDGSTSNNVSTITGFDPNFVGIYRSCNVPASPYFIGGTYYNGCYYMGNGIAASNCFIYIYTGNEVHKFDIFNPTALGSSTITNGVQYMNSGILSDVCNNFYVGTQTGISAYDASFNLITSVATTRPVFDLAFSPGNTIAACGIGFVGVYANVQQVCAPIACNPSPNLPMTGSSAFTPMTGCNTNDGTGSVINILNGTGPYTYVWSNGGTTSSISGLGSGTYTCTITDASCPAETFTVTITIPPSSGPTTTLSSTSILCFGGNASSTASVTGGSSPYTYLWSNGQTNATATNLPAGNYTVVVTDANGCTSQQTITITQPTPISISIPPSSVACNGGNNASATANSSGGTSPYTYLWSNAQTNLTATNLSAGTYTVVVTDANGCTSQQTITITQPTVLSGSTTVTNTLCSSSSGSATATGAGGTGPYTYVWSNSQSGATASNLNSGTYTVTITDANGCTATATATISNTNGPTVTANSTGTILCNGGNNASANATATGGTAPYTYSWSNSQTTQSISNLGAGTYTVYVTDANGCSSQQIITITQPSILTLALTSTPDTCNSNNGTANSNPTGGTSPYTYLWSNGATTQNLNAIPSGTYIAVITDANGCTATQTITVASVGSATAYAGIDVTITQGNSTQLSATGGGTYSWVPPTGLSCSNCANPVASPTSTTTYIVYVTNSNGCTASDTVTIYVDIPCTGSLMTALFPNAFSPNHDGENERLCVPPNTCISQFHLKIYDRWGELVFESEDLRTCWDGTFKGKELNTSVYVFFFEAVMTNGDKFSQQGNVSLIK